MKVSDLAGSALDWAVAKSVGRTLRHNPMGAMGGHGWWVWEEVPSGQGGILLHLSVYMEIGPRKFRNSEKAYSPSTIWKQGGPIIERERLSVSHAESDAWVAETPPSHDGRSERGPTPLIAAMRCYVASALGDEIDIPKELLR